MQLIQDFLAFLVLTVFINRSRPLDFDVYIYGFRSLLLLFLFFITYKLQYQVQLDLVLIGVFLLTASQLYKFYYVVKDFMEGVTEI